MVESIRELCISKADEFRLYGYVDVEHEQIWLCVCEKYKRGLPRIHKVVNDILNLNAQNFMNWIMLNIFKGKSEAFREGTLVD